MEKFSFKPAARAQRKQTYSDPSQRIADTLDDIAEALEEIARELGRRR